MVGIFDYRLLIRPNFRSKIGEIGPLAFIRRPGIPRRIGISQFRFRNVTWQWFLYVVRKFGERRSSNPGVYEGQRRATLVDQQWSYFRYSL